MKKQRMIIIKSGLHLIYLSIITACKTTPEKKELGNEGIYNGQVADYDQDGDFDISPYPSNESDTFYLYKN